MADRTSIARLSSGRVRYPMWDIVRHEVRHVLRYVVIAVVLSLITYLCVASTVARYVSVPGVGWVYTANPRSSLKHGDRVVFDKDKGQDDTSDADTVFGRLALTALPPEGLSTGRIIAGPDGRLVKGDDGRIRVGGVDTGLKGDGVRGYLVEQYVVECTGGACGKGGASMIVPASAIDGSVIDRK